LLEENLAKLRSGRLLPDKTFQYDSKLIPSWRNTVSASLFLRNAISEFRRYKSLAEGAITQIPEPALFEVLDRESNSIAMLMKHMSGNLLSRWSDFLVSDGDKPSRDRESEFRSHLEDTKQNVLERWEAGWTCLFAALEGLRPNDLEKTISIRGEPCTVMEAIHRGMMHAAYHVGQIALLAKHYAGANWQSLSIPRGKSEEYRAGLRPEGRRYWMR
jgi:hypothetical protein